MAPGSEKERLSKEQLDAIRARCDEYHDEDFTHDVTGSYDQLRRQMAEDMPSLFTHISHLESLLAVAVGGLRKAWRETADNARYYSNGTDQRWVPLTPDQRLHGFCKNFGITLEQFAALGIGENK